MKTEQLKKNLRSRKSAEGIDWKRGLSTGSTLVNLACSGRPDVGLLQGHYYCFVGDSQAGKTWLSLQIMAEAAANPAFAQHRLIHDNPERGALMDVRRYFGRLADRLEPPEETFESRRAFLSSWDLLGSPSLNSSTLEEFYDHVDDACRAGKPFVYVLDSEDALPSETDVEKSSQDRRNRRRGREISGSYGTAKPKVNSARLREAHNRLAETGSILIIIKQTRENIGYTARLEPKTRSGGKALTFYATLEMWFSVARRIKREVKGHKLVQGSVLRIHVKKNRMAGLDRAVEIPFYSARGFDEVGSMVNFIIEWKHWPESKGIITADEFDFRGSSEELVQKIERENQEKVLRLITSEVWGGIEKNCEVIRKPRYG